MKISVTVAVLFLLTFCMSSGTGIKKHVKDLDRTEILQEILRRFFLIGGDLGVRKVHDDVGFLVYLAGGYTTSSSHAIKFTSVDRNDGNGYNTGTGMFVAPVAGLYHFYWNILTYKGKAIVLDLMLNGKERLKSWVHAQQTYERPSGSVYLRLQKGDKVYLQGSNAGGTFHSGRYSTFGGELIRY